MRPIALSLLALLLLASCEGNSPTDPWVRYGNTLTGHVVDKYGNIWGGVTVAIWSSDGKGSSTLTDMQGNYVLRGFPPGRYRLIVHLGRTASGDAVNTEIELHEGQNVYDITTP